MDAAKIERSIGGRFEQFFTAAMMTPIINPLKIDLEDCRWGIPVNFIGDSGVGKTERIKTLGAMIGQPTWTIYSSTKSPEHFAGVFVPSPDGEVHVVCGLPQVKDALCFRGGIIFLDEVSCASSSVQAALLSFVNERQVGEYALPNRTRIVLAMNPADIAAHGQELEIPLANRAAEFMLANGGSYEVRSDEKDKDGKVVTVKKTKLHNRPDPEEPQSGGAWPSHRTWSWAMFGVTTIRCLGLDPKLEIDMVECLVGPALATEWASYCAKVDLPSPMEAMSGTWKIPRRIDIVRATMNSCVDWVLNRKR